MLSNTARTVRFSRLTRLAALVAATAVLGCVHGAGAATSSPEAGGVAKRQIRATIAGAHGSVISVPRGIDCEPRCAAAFSEGTEVTLVAGSRRESIFEGWSGDCVGASSLCVVLADRTVNVKATFRRADNTEIGYPPVVRSWLYVTAPRSGGKIRSSGGISCPGTCKTRLPNGTVVTLRAYPDGGYARRPVWGTNPAGICQGDRCKVRLESDVHVAAIFKRAR